MYQKMMRFKVIKDNRIFETILDERLSFTDNFKMLVNIDDYDLDGFKVYDPFKKMFLNCDIPIEEFAIKDFRIMYLF